MSKRSGAAWLTGIAAWLAASAANAGGFEFPENGSLAMGRGGAFLVRASDPTALMHNTAGIVGLPGFQIVVSSNFSMLQHCFARAGNYQGPMDGVSVLTDDTAFVSSNYAGDIFSPAAAYPRICSTPSVFPAPQILATWRPTERLAFGLGVYGPNSVGRMAFPDKVMTPAGLAPSPNRYMLLREDLLVIHPTLAIAVAPERWFRVGVAIQPSFAHFEFSTLANSVTGAAQSPKTDLQTTVRASGFFLAFNAGLQLVAPRYFSFGLHVHMNPSQISMSGTGDARAQYYSNPSTNITSTFTVPRLTANLPLQVRWGARFQLPSASARARQDAPDYDPMRDDLLDFEINWIYERASVFQDLSIETSGSVRVDANTNAPLPAVINVPHRWRDVWGIRAGGDINVIPSLLAVRLGMSYETGAQSPFYGQIDFAAYSSLGVNGGLSMRVGPVTISAAYGHYIMPDFTVVSAAGGNVTTIGTSGTLRESDCGTGTGTAPCHVNVGTYSAALDIFNVGLHFRF